MSRASETFETSIEDAVSLLNYYNGIKKDPPDEGEVLKRAGLVMALTAWETYVEDRIVEALKSRLRTVSGSSIARFVQGKLEEELKRFHTPNSEKTKRIFLDYLDIDVTAHWSWANFKPAEAKKRLDGLISKRGEVVHRSKSDPNLHPVKREDLEKAIRFLRGLVAATEQGLADC
jgi:hypothetical protein